MSSDLRHALFPAPLCLIIKGKANMKKSAIIILLVSSALVLAAAVLVAARGRRAAASRSAAKSAQPAPREAQLAAGDAGNGLDIIRFASNAMPAPPFLVNDLAGGIVSTAQFRGKVVILNFWATWCPPCREEIPEMIQLAKEFKDKLQIIGVSMDDAPPVEVKQFAQNVGINYPVVMGSRWIAGEYGGVPALPTSYLVDPSGRVVQKHVGLYPIQVYEEEIRALLNLPVSARIETFQDTGQIFLKNAALATELPAVNFNGLTSAQKSAALKRMNSEYCTCGCQLTIAQCRINDESCTTSQGLAAAIIREIRLGGKAHAASSSAK